MPPLLLLGLLLLALLQLPLPAAVPCAAHAASRTLLMPPTRLRPTRLRPPRLWPPAVGRLRVQPPQGQRRPRQGGGPAGGAAHRGGCHRRPPGHPYPQRAGCAPERAPFVGVLRALHAPLGQRNEGSERWAVGMACKGLPGCHFLLLALVLAAVSPAGDEDNFVVGLGLDCTSAGVEVAHPTDPNAPDMPPQPVLLVRAGWRGVGSRPCGLQHRVQERSSKARQCTLLSQAEASLCVDSIKVCVPAGGHLGWRPALLHLWLPRRRRRRASPLHRRGVAAAAAPAGGGGSGGGGRSSSSACCRSQRRGARGLHGAARRVGFRGESLRDTPMNRHGFMQAAMQPHIRVLAVLASTAPRL